jgi:Fungal protein kinase
MILFHRMTLFSIPGHRRLSEIGILHRDISPGNIYLWDIEGNGRAPSEGNEGFIADLELASVPQEATTLVAVPVTADIPVKRIQAGPYLIPIPSNAPQSPPPQVAATPQRMVFESRPVPSKSDPGPSFTVSCCLNTC